MTTKRDIINGAFEELGLGAHIYDITPENYASALGRLDGLMAEWSADGAATGYPVMSQPDAATLDDEIGLIMPLREGVIASLALKIAPSFGKSPSPDTMRTANRGRALAACLQRPAAKKQRATNSTPAGAGNRYYGGSYLPSSKE